jgi:hypothetical protein
MMEHPIASEPPSPWPLAESIAEPQLAQEAGGAPSGTIETVRQACFRIARFGRMAAWGLLALGALAGLEKIVPLAIDHDATAGAWARAWAGCVFAVVGYGLAGLAASVIATIAAAALNVYLDRLSEASATLLNLASRSVADLDRIVDALEKFGGHAIDPAGSTVNRAARLDEIRRAIASGHWSQAQTSLSAFAADFPDDSHTATLNAQFSQARHDARQQLEAKLDAAREVNDPDAVLETYQTLAGLLDADARHALDRDLAKWFLALIHRRLRSTKIQPDVVQLASRFAEAFAATAEGASVRAALPTLRRSVGLCPRCGAPYVGVAEACPKCLEALQYRSDAPSPPG